MKLSKVLIFLLVLFAICPAHATITQIQGASNFAAASSSVAVTVSSTVLGNLIVVHGMADTTGRTITITDNKGNTYTPYTGFNSINISGGGHASTDTIAYTIDAFGAVTSVTATDNSSDNMTVTAGEFNSTNGWPSNPRDKSSTNGQGGVTSFTTNSTATTTKASELLVGCALFVNDPGAVTPTGSFLLSSNGGLHNSRLQYMAYRVVSSTGTYAFTGTTANSTDPGTAILTFQDNPTPSGSRFVRFTVPESVRGVGHWAITDRERKRV